MEIKGEYEIAAPRERVWDALNDPDVLKACIPGCESLEKTADNAFEAKVTAKVGPVKARFGGNVTLENMNPPESYSIVGEGKGGAAGFAKGGADVHLTEKGENLTLLSYNVNANVGGKLAQLGTRLIQGTSKRMADEFFAKFREQVEGAAPAPAAQAPAQPAAAPEVPPAPEPTAPPTPPAEPAPAAPAEPAPPPPTTVVPPAPEASAAAATAAAESRTDAAQAPSAEPGTADAGTHPSAAASAPRREREHKTMEPPPAPKTMSPAVWIGGLVVIILLLIWLIT